MTMSKATIVKTLTAGAFKQLVRRDVKHLVFDMELKDGDILEVRSTNKPDRAYFSLEFHQRIESKYIYILKLLENHIEADKTRFHIDTTRCIIYDTETGRQQGFVGGIQDAHMVAKIFIRACMNDISILEVIALIEKEKPQKSITG